MILVLRETHDVPEGVARSLELAGGINRFREPNYRAVWGWNRLAWIGGKFAERDPATGSLLREIVELRQEPKYPVRGEYEHCFTLESPRGEFVQLTATVAEHIARAIEWSRKHPRSAGKRALQDRERRQDRSYDAYAYDILDDAVPAFHRQPFVIMKGT